MSRWKPDARTRLEKAALALYRERGFAQTTVAEIAERAGLTERTFFRYFADKREVLFAGGDALQQQLLSALNNAASSLSAIDAVGAAIEASAGLLERRRDFARKRHAVIAENPELQERERVKLASLAAALAEGLRRRGVREPAASLAAEMGITVFRIAFERWIDDTSDRGFAPLVRESLNELKLVTMGERG
ncbi:MAG: TetR family transcriptional regulator [Candidatus Eremiobacteraeota bacterium]|nr:TetR family transcriptional regulator [Candidatus Eremiobacteraeota bacterium]